MNNEQVGRVRPSIVKSTSKIFSSLLLTLILLAAALAPAAAAGQTWEFIGNRNISGASSNYAVLISDGAGIPYVLFNDSQVGGRASVMSWDGTNWNFVGARGFSNAPVTQRGDIAFDDAGNVWVITVGDLNADDNLEVWKFDGTSWTELGPQKDRTGIEPKIEFNNGQPYIVFREGFTNGWAISVMTYDGIGWNYVGSSNFTSQISSFQTLAFYNGEPYVAYADRDQGFRASVKKFNGTSWDFVGAPGFTVASGGGTAFWAEIEISQSGVPYIAYVDGNTGTSGDSRLNVMKFDGTSWVQVGPVNFAKAFWSGLEFDGDTPYVGFENIGSSVGRGASVMRFNGTDWEYVGDEVFSPYAFGTTFNVYNGVLRIAFLDYFENQGTSVMQLGSANQPPTAAAGGPYSGDEGSVIALNGASASDPDGDALTYSWTVDSTLCSFDDASALNPNLTCADNGSFTATLEVSDGTETVSSDAAVNVSNVAPTLGAISVDMAVVPVNTAINASASFTDPGTLDTHTAAWDWGDGTSAGTVTQGAGSGSVDDSHSYSMPGVYTLKLKVTDDDGGVSNEAVYQYVVVYDPSGGFVTGGGWIHSPAGAYAADPSLTGKATFGFVAKYKKGANVPDGNTQFQFKAGDLNFHSSSYEWLVVAGNKAQFKGVGTINGQGSYKFMISADDDSPDTFRIQIWGDNGMVYDNGSKQALGGGSIKVHK